MLESKPKKTREKELRSPAAGLSHGERAKRRKKMAAAVKRVGDLGKVATEFGVSIRLVKDACIEHKVGIPKPDSDGPLFSTYKVIAALINTTETMTAIAIRHGLSPQRVNEIKDKCVEAGIKLKPRYRGGRRKTA